MTEAIGPGATRRRGADDPRIAVANQLQAAGRLDEADALLDEIVAAVPAAAEAFNLKGVVAGARGDLAGAALWVDRAARADRRNALYPRNLTEIHRRLGNLDEGLRQGRRAVELDPRDAEAWYHLAMIHYERLEMERAIHAARRAIALAPVHAGAHFELAEALLVTGRLEEGWQAYEWRWRLPGASPAPEIVTRSIPAWDGRPLGDRALFLVGDQGFGDTIQFARYVPLAAERCGEVILGLSAELAAFVGTVTGAARIVSVLDAPPAAAAYAPLSGLPHLLGTASVAAIPTAVPYLSVDPARAARFADRIAGFCPEGHRRIGIAWAGRPTHGNDRNRSLSLADLAPLGDVPGASIVALQKGPGAAAIGQSFWQAPFLNLGPELRDFMDTAAAIAGLDLVVTVDTSVAHVAGAIGKPCWILLPFAPDWRWLLGRADTPWYPSVRLFRQPAPGAWAPVVEAVVDALGAP
jgi:Flp pilus assembly protein TadD